MKVEAPNRQKLSIVITPRIPTNHFPNYLVKAIQSYTYQNTNIWNIMKIILNDIEYLDNEFLNLKALKTIHDAILSMEKKFSFTPSTKHTQLWTDFNTRLFIFVRNGFNLDEDSDEDLDQ